MICEIFFTQHDTGLCKGNAWFADNDDSAFVSQLV